MTLAHGSPDWDAYRGRLAVLLRLRVDPALHHKADVYALGAILYEVLTGRPPFRGESQMETLLQVLERDPPRPRALDPRADADLETVCLKCLEKEPQRRYASADALADDLQRWLDGLPILARPAGSGERVVKWAKRRPAIAALAAALVWVAAGGVGGIVWKWQHAVAAEQDARVAADAERDAKVQERDARVKEARARKAAEEAEKKEKKATEEAQEAEQKQKKAKEVAQQAEKQEKQAKEAAQRAEKREVEARKRTDGLRLAAEADAARFRDPGLALLLAVEGAQKAPAHLTFSALYGALGDCRELRTLGNGGEEDEDRNWHIYRGIVNQARFLPDGQRVLSVCGASLRVYDPVSGKQLQQWPGYNLPLTGVAVDAAGKRSVLTGSGYAVIRHSDGRIYTYTDRLAYVIDLTTNKEVLRLRGAEYKLTAAEFSPDGKQIVTASWDGSARLHDAATGKLLFTMTPPNDSPLVKVLGKKSLLLARFTPDGKHVLTVSNNDQRFSYSYDDSDKKSAGADPDFDPQYRPLSETGHGEGAARVSFDAESVIGHLWDAATGKQVTYYYKPPPGWLNFGHVWRPSAADISPDSTSLAIALDGVVSVYEMTTGKRRFDLTGHYGEIHAVAFSPDSKLIATAGADKTVHLWDAANGREKLRLRGHTEGVAGLRFDRTGKLLASWSADRTARVWETDSGIEKAVMRGHTSMVNAADFGPDSKTLITAGDTTVRVWTLGPPKMPDTRLDGHKGKATALAYSPDGSRAVTSSADGTARLWDTATGQQLRVFGEGRNLGEIRSAHFSPDGKRIITAASLSTSVVGDKVTLSAVIVWDAATGDDVMQLKGLDTGALTAYFIDDGKRLLTVGDGYVRFQRAPAKPKEPAKDDKKEPAKDDKEVEINGIRIRIEHGKSVDAGRVQLWDAATGKLLANVAGKGNGGWTSSNDQLIPAVSPDGSRLVLFDHADRTPKVYDAVTAKVVAELRGPRQWQKPTFQFSPDGRFIVLEQGTDIAIHDADTGTQLARLHDFPDWNRHFALSADGKRLVVAASKFAFVWDVEKRTLVSTLRGHEDKLTTVALNADGSRVLTGAQDHTVGLWDADTGAMRALYRGHTGIIRQVTFRPDGKQVATVADDGTPRLWPTDLWSVVLPRRTRELTDDERDRYDLPAAPGKERQPDKQPKFDPPPGTPTPEPFRLPPEPVDPAAEKKAAAALAPLRAEVEKGPADAGALRQKVVDLRKDFPATAAAVEAARLLERLPGPLAALDPAKIAAPERTAQLPKDVVAVLGEGSRRQWSGLDGIAISPSGKVVVSYAPHGGTISLWDADTLAPRGQVIGGHYHGFRAGQDELIVGYYEGVGLWDVSGTEPKQRASVSTKNANGYQAVSGDGRFAVGFANHQWDTPVLWDLKAVPPTRRPLLKLAKGRHLNGVVFTPDSAAMIVSLDRKEIILFDLRGDEPKRRWSLAFPDETPDKFTFSPDGKLLAAPIGKTIRVWDVTAEPKLVAELSDPKSTASLVAFAADSHSLWASYWNAPLRQWDLTAEPPKEMAQLPGEAEKSRPFAVAPDGKRAFTADGVAFRAWELVNGEWKQRLQPRGHTHQITSLAFSPDDGTLFSADSNAQVRVWDWKAGGQERHHLPGVADQLRLTPDGRDLIAGRGAFTIWDVSGAAPRQRTQPADPHHYSAGIELALSGNGKRLARGSGRPALTLLDLSGAAPRQVAVVKTIGEQNNGAASVTLSPDGRLLIVAADERTYTDTTITFGHDRGPVCAWRVTDSGLTPLTFPYLIAERVAFSPDGRTLAAVNIDLELWDLTLPVPRMRSKLPAKQERFQGFDFCWTPAGDRIVTWSGTKLITWDVSTGKELQAWTWPGTITTVEPAHDGRHLAVGNANGTVYLLRIAAK